MLVAIGCQSENDQKEVSEQPAKMFVPHGLVEVVFAEDDRPTDQTFHTIVIFWISENQHGKDRQIYDWATQGAHHQTPTPLRKPQNV